ncbi:MAG: zinc ribbon domain-containing protein [Alphaproteobacteria bacterium]|nr:zinc ribbon domain-containing protein [Alphaproteobacteria bacterium]
MPRYEYVCDQCGGFAENRPIAEYADPQPCPGCGALAARALTVPSLGAGTSEPASLSASWQPGGGARHFGGCSCCGGSSGFRSEAVSAQSG